MKQKDLEEMMVTETLRVSMMTQAMDALDKLMQSKSSPSVPKQEKRMISIASCLSEAEAMAFCSRFPTMNLSVVKEVDERFHVYDMEGK